MFQSATLDHVHKLHSLGHQLGVLKRMYEGYNLIIERIIYRPRQLNTGPVRVGYTKETDKDSSGDKSGQIELGKMQAEEYGVPITSAAALRFERLKDRITLYALSEIGSCIDEKNSLMAMVSSSMDCRYSSLIKVTELQFDCHQRRILCRAAYTHHNLAGEDHHPVHSC